MDKGRALFAIGQTEAPVREMWAGQVAEVMDRRAARTRRALHGALMSLILRKGHEAITVQDIVDEADVGRSTFYAHYAGKSQGFEDDPNPERRQGGRFQAAQGKRTGTDSTAGLRAVGNQRAA
jgi:AcrR family transcriptional regulator